MSNKELETRLSKFCKGRQWKYEVSAFKFEIYIYGTGIDNLNSLIKLIQEHDEYSLIICPTKKPDLPISIEIYKRL